MNFISDLLFSEAIFPAPQARDTPPGSPTTTRPSTPQSPQFDLGRPSRGCQGSCRPRSQAGEGTEPTCTLCSSSLRLSLSLETAAGAVPSFRRPPRGGGQLSAAISRRIPTEACTGCYSSSSGGHPPPTEDGRKSVVAVSPSNNNTLSRPLKCLKGSQLICKHLSLLYP